MRPRLLTALRAGFTAYAGALLLATLLSAPLSAGHQDFGHSHPAHTGSHLHSVQSFFGATAAVPVVVWVSSALVVILAFAAPLTPERRQIKLILGSRAPPAR